MPAPTVAAIVRKLFRGVASLSPVAQGGGACRSARSQRVPRLAVQQAAPRRRRAQLPCVRLNTASVAPLPAISRAVRESLVVAPEMSPDQRPGITATRNACCFDPRSGGPVLPALMVFSPCWVA